MQRPEARSQQLISELTCCHRDWSLLHWDKQMCRLKKAQSILHSQPWKPAKWSLSMKLSDWKVSTWQRKCKMLGLLKLQRGSTFVRMNVFPKRIGNTGKCLDTQLFTYLFSLRSRWLKHISITEGEYRWKQSLKCFFTLCLFYANPTYFLCKASGF